MLEEKPDAAECLESPALMEAGVAHGVDEAELDEVDLGATVAEAWVAFVSWQGVPFDGSGVAGVPVMRTCPARNAGRAAKPFRLI